MLVLLIVSMNGCVPGITINSIKVKNDDILNYATSSKTFDIYFKGAFCPPTNGEYRLVYEGKVHFTNENQYSNYDLLGGVQKSRIGPFKNLVENVCYKYQTVHS